MIEFEEILTNDSVTSAAPIVEDRAGFACGVACENGMCCGLGCGSGVGGFCGTGCVKQLIHEHFLMVYLILKIEHAFNKRGEDKWQ